MRCSQKGVAVLALPSNCRVSASAELTEELRRVAHSVLVEPILGSDF